MRKLAALGGSYGNTSALNACLEDARGQGADTRAFLGDAIGCCAHSEEVLAIVKASFDVLVAGNHEQQAAMDSDSCGCGYASPEDEAISCEAFRLATEALTPESKEWLGTWPDRAFVELEGGRVLLCHGSPGQTAEFLYELELDDLRLEAWLDKWKVRGFVCTHSGLPWIRHLRGGRFAVNCGAVGKPDHDGDRAVHYAMIDLPAQGEPALEIRRVEYDVEPFAKECEALGVADVFLSPLRTGIWTTGTASLPAGERHRPLRSGPMPNAPSWTAELMREDRFRSVLGALVELRQLAPFEAEQVMHLLSADNPYFAATRLATSLHLHVKVEDTKALPHAQLRALGAALENERDGYVKYTFEGGINFIASSIPIAEEDSLPDPSGDSPWQRLEKPFLDHVGVDLRRETGVVRARFEEVPAVAQRIGWAHVRQGGRGRAVHCCHTHVAEKHWVYPRNDEGAFERPLEFAYGPLEISTETSGCDLRPIDPRHPAAPDFVAC